MVQEVKQINAIINTIRSFVDVPVSDIAEKINYIIINKCPKTLIIDTSYYCHDIPNGGYQIYAKCINDTFKLVIYGGGVKHIYVEVYLLKG